MSVAPLPSPPVLASQTQPNFCHETKIPADNHGLTQYDDFSWIDNLTFFPPTDFKTEEELLSYIHENYQKTVATGEIMYSCARNLISTIKAFLKSRGTKELEVRETWVGLFAINVVAYWWVWFRCLRKCLLCSTWFKNKMRTGVSTFQRLEVGHDEPVRQKWRKWARWG